MLQKFQGDSALYDFDCTAILADDETIVAVTAMSQWPSFPELDPGLLVFGEPIVNAAPIVYADGRTMEAGKGFQVNIAGGTPLSEVQRRVYAVLGTLTTSNDNTLTSKAELLLLPPGIGS